MSDLDIKNQKEAQKNSPIDFLNKSSICLFDFSNIKSQNKLSVSQFNSFKYDLSIRRSKKLKNKLKKSLKRKNKFHYIKYISTQLPSNEKLSDEEFKNKFINDFNESYAHYCGLNERQYTEIFINNHYVPILDEVGDITISAKSIFDTLREFSDTKGVKINRKFLKRNKVKNKIKLKNANSAQKKISKISKINQEEEAKEVIEINLRNNSSILSQNDANENNYDKDEVIKNQNIESSFSEKKYNEKIGDKLNGNQENKTLLNIKKNLKNISIPGANKKNLPLKDNSNFSNGEQNNNSLLINGLNSSNDNNKKILSNYFQNLTLNNQTNSANPLSHPNLQASHNNNVFNFSSNIIQNFENNSQNKNKTDINGKPLFTPFNNNSLNINQIYNINYNSPLSRPVLSPLNLTSGLGNTLSPNSYNNIKSNIFSPVLISASPFNNNVLNDKFTFNNVNTSSFFFGDNNVENNDNNCENNNIINEKIIENNDNKINENNDIKSNYNHYNYNNDKIKNTKVNGNYN